MYTPFSYHYINDSANTTLATRNCCWICNDYVEVEFVYQFSISDMVMINKVIDFITENPSTTSVKGYIPGRTPLLTDIW